MCGLPYTRGAGCQMHVHQSGGVAPRFGQLDSPIVRGGKHSRSAERLLTLRAV